MKTLNISKELKLPLNAVTQTFAIMAKRGVGKTHTASVMAEEMLKQDQPVVVYDPTSAWWGLKSSADGKRPGFPIVIFGGEHADVPLEESAGEMIATVIVERRMSAILDCGLMRKGARIRFMTAFCEALYHKNREPLHFFIDEAQTVAPQNLKAMPEIARLVGALEDIILQGRRRGLGVTVISPRPAILNTSIRSACEVLIAMQIVGPHDRKAIQEWIDVHGDDINAAKEMMSTLSSLKRGEAWIWSPAWLEIFLRTKFRSRETFDSSATPEVGSHVSAPSKMADVDLKKLGAEIAATVERVKADDPKSLRARIAVLERELSAKLAAPKAASAKRIEVPALKNGEIKQLKLFIDTIANSAKHYNDAKYTMESALGNVETIVKEINSILQKVTNADDVRQVEPKFLNKTNNAVAKQELDRRRPDKAFFLPVGKPQSGNAVGLTPMDRAILTVLAQFPQGCRANKIVLLAGYTLNGSTRNSFSKLRTAGLIVGGNTETMRITKAGTDAVGAYDPLPITGDELRRYWLNHKMLTPMDRALLKSLTNYPGGLEAQALCSDTGYTLNGSTRNSLSKLRTAGLIVGKNTEVMRAVEELLS